jgi:hypothetical protein
MGSWPRIPSLWPPADDNLLAPLEDVVRDLADDIDQAWHTART